MARAANTGRGKSGRDGGRAGQGCGSQGRGTSGTIPRKATELGACKELEGHIFTIGSGNKGKDGDMMRTSIEKMATYIGTKFGDDAAQEWVSNKKTILPEPTYSQAILNRHAQRVRATKDRIELKLRGLAAEKTAIEAEIQVESSRTLLRELREVDDQIAKCNIELSDKVEMKLMEDEKIAHSNAWRTHREALKASRRAGARSTHC